MGLEKGQVIGVVERGTGRVVRGEISMFYRTDSVDSRLRVSSDNCSCPIKRNEIQFC